MNPAGEHSSARKRRLSPDSRQPRYLNTYSQFLRSHIDGAEIPGQTALPSQIQVDPPTQTHLAGVDLYTVHNDGVGDDHAAGIPAVASTTLDAHEHGGATSSVLSRSSPVPFRTLTRDIANTSRKRIVRPSRRADRFAIHSSTRARRSTTSRLFRNDQSSAAHGAGEDAQPSTAPALYIPTILDSSLDPFFALPDNLVLTPGQRAYIHLYFKELSPVVFGTTQKALYCPRYTVGYHTARLSPAGIMWLIVVAMQCANLQRGASSPDRAMQIQIQSAFAHLHAAIQNARQNPVGVCLALMFANLAEVIMGTHRLQGLYTTAIESVVEAAGGLRRFQSMSPLPGVYVGAVYTFFSHRPRSLKELEMVKLRWMASMADVERQLLRLSQTYRLARARSEASSQLTFATESMSRNSNPHSTAYLEDDPRSFSVADSEMIPFVRAMITPTAGTGYMSRTTAVYLMHELIWALVDFGGRPEHMRKYHNRLKFLIRHSLVGGGQVGSTSYMAGGMAALIVARARQETYEDMIGAEDEEIKLERTRTSIDSLKMFTALGEAGREILLDTFRSWVLDVADMSRLLRTFSDESTATLGSEALENWFASETATG